MGVPDVFLSKPENLKAQNSNNMALKKVVKVAFS